MKQYHLINLFRVATIFQLLVLCSEFSYSQNSNQLDSLSGNLESSQLENDTNEGKRAIYFEFGGPAVIYSVNYEYSFSNEELTPFIRVGASVSTGVIFPLEFGFHTNKKNGFEIGGGMSISSNDGQLFFAKAGYRRTSEKGFLFKVTPMYISSGIIAIPWIGISLGKRF